MILTQTAEVQGCQVIAASHSEVLLNEAADRDIVVAFVGKPHRIEIRRARCSSRCGRCDLTSISGRADGLGPISGGVYDLAILQGFARLLSIPQRGSGTTVRPLRRNLPLKPRTTFFGLMGSQAGLGWHSRVRFDSAELDENPRLRVKMAAERD